MADELFLLLILVAAFTAVIRLLSRISRREHEFGRFSAGRRSWLRFVVNDIARIVERRVAARRALVNRDERSAEMRRLVEAGLTSAEAQERYFLAREFILLVAIFVGFISVIWYPPVVAAPLVILGAVIAVSGPRIWILSESLARQQSVEYDLPFVLQSLAIASREGAEPLRILDRIADTVSKCSVGRPLTLELERAQWCASTGGTWVEALALARTRAGSRERLADSFESLGDIVASDGAHSEQLKTLATDAHGAWVSRLELKGGMLAVRVLGMIGMVLLGIFFMLQQPYVMGGQ